jgi:hydrogenase 3 maturation protease
MIATPHDTADIGASVPLKRVLSGRVCILGVGNRHRRDDGVGSLIAERLATRHPALTIDAGAVPENYLEKVARSCPDTVLIIDAVDFGGCPGEIRLLDPDTIATSGISSHALSLRMTAQYLEARTQAGLVLLAIQPADIGTGTELSDEVCQAIKTAEQTLSAALEQHARNRDSQIGGGVMSPGGA